MITYRKATVEDIPLLTQLRQTFMEDVGPLDDAGRAAFAYYPEFLREGLANGSFVQFLAILDGAAVATGSVNFYRLPPTARRPNGNVAYIGTMFTYPVYRRQGLATNILQLLIDEAKARRCGEILLNASPQGQPLYETFGFVQTDHMMRFQVL